MELHEYPRPQDDTGIGVHWSAGQPAAIGIDNVRKFWLPELAALGVKWVTFRHEEGLELAELLLAHGIMPVVRFSRPSLNPGVLGEQALQAVGAFVAAGVRYFEFGSEPDRPQGWSGGQLPADALAVTARHAVQDMEAILERGGFPCIPAVASGGRWDLVGAIVALGRSDLLEGPVWQAVHNYALNHPLDYPVDSGNQSGAPLSQAFFDLLDQESWEGSAWRGRDLSKVNAERRANANPGATVHDDPYCWQSFQYFNELARQHVGRGLPVLVTEGGWQVGEFADTRYPAVTPLWHGALTLEACRTMMGTSTRYGPAPDYLFCSGFTLLGNYILGYYPSRWEGWSWYSPTRPGGRLPIVGMLREEPKVARKDQGESPSPAASRVTGVVYGGAGLVVQLVRRDDGRRWDVTVAPDETLVVEELAAGTYYLELVGRGMRSEDFHLDGRNRASVALSVAAWRYTTRDVGVGPGFSMIRCSIKGRLNLPVRLRAEGWAGLTRMTGSKPELGQYTCEFAPLAAGEYVVEPEDLGVVASVRVDGRRIVQVDFVPDTGEAAGRVAGIIHGWPDRALLLEGQDRHLPALRTHTDEAGLFLFNQVPVGHYLLLLEDGQARIPSGSGTLEVRPDETLSLELRAPRDGADDKLLDHYLWVGAGMELAPLFEAAMAYVSRFRPEVGEDLVRASQSRHVTLLGDRQAIPEGIEQVLKDGGSQVDRVAGHDAVAELRRRLAAGRPW